MIGYYQGYFFELDSLPSTKEKKSSYKLGYKHVLLSKYVVVMLKFSRHTLLNFFFDLFFLFPKTFNSNFTPFLNMQSISFNIYVQCILVHPLPFSTAPKEGVSYALSIENFKQ